MKKKYLTLSLLLSLFSSVFLFSGSPVHAASNSTYFTEAQLTDIVSAGFPSNYKSSIYKVWEVFMDDNYFGSTAQLGSGDLYSEFKRFVSNVKSISSATSDETSSMTRALYLEVSNLSNRVASVTGASDCMTNRIISGMASNYKAAFKGLDGLNSSSSNYWHNIMKNPLPDAIGGGTDSIRALVVSYRNSFIMLANEDQLYPWFMNATPSTYSRFSTLPTGYLYFNETSGTGRIKIGDFYFRKTY